MVSAILAVGIPGFVLVDDDDDGIYWYSETVTPASTHYWAEQSCFCTTRAI